MAFLLIIPNYCLQRSEQCNTRTARCDGEAYGEAQFGEAKVGEAWPKVGEAWPLQKIAHAKRTTTEDYKVGQQ